MGLAMAPGDIIKGKYRVERLLGEGGMGVVVAAHHIALDQRVAIKLLQPALAAEPEIVERFAREARAASRIESEHVARVTDVDTLDDGTPFMVMEHLDGRDLSWVREAGRGLPAEVAVGYVIDACAAIAEAHRRDIVHRDVKPANLFVARKGDGRTLVKVLDFGISKIGGGEGGAPRVTNAGAVIGSAEYMSPEQMVSPRDVDARTDIWALGVTLYELLTARVPFPGESVTQICALVMSAEPAPPSSIAPGVPPGLDRVVLRCLVKDRSQRYADVPALVEALAPFGPADGARASLASAPWVPSSGPRLTDPMAATVAGTTSATPALPVRSMWPLAIGAAVIALGLAAVAGVSIFASRGPAQGAVPPIGPGPSVAAPAVTGAPPIATPGAPADPPGVSVADLPDARPAPAPPASAASSSRPRTKAAERAPAPPAPPAPKPPDPPRHTLD